jgi:hypothetical protein
MFEILHPARSCGLSALGLLSPFVGTQLRSRIAALRAVYKFREVLFVRGVRQTNPCVVCGRNGYRSGGKAYATWNGAYWSSRQKAVQRHSRKEGTHPKEDVPIEIVQEDGCQLVAPWTGLLGYRPFVCGKEKGQQRDGIGDKKESSKRSNAHPALRTLKYHPFTR